MKNVFISNVGTIFLIGYIFLWITVLEYATTIEKRDIPDLLFILNRTVKERGEISPHHYPILKAYVNIDENHSWLSSQTSNTLKLHTFPTANKQLSCHNEKVSLFPVSAIDSYPEGDAYLPWIHDVFPNRNGTMIQIIAQNRRRCHTGKENVRIMKRLEGQIALMQPVAVKRNIIDNVHSSKNVTYQLTSYDDADLDGKETRFLCRFKVLSASTMMFQESSYDITLSRYPFNYEYIHWQKGKSSMMMETGKDMASFWLSSLEFHCPVPSHIIPFLHMVGESKRENPVIFMDIAAIRTPVRKNDQQSFSSVHKYGSFNEKAEWGSNIALPSFDESGRWENIPICSTTRNFLNKDENEIKKVDFTYQPDEKSPKKKPFQLVACTWTSAIHNRRGDARRIDDGADRLMEWIAFHLNAGFDHIFVYDNSAASTNLSLLEVTNKFSSRLVTRVNWPCKICNNNRPAHNDPGERSSQYAAEASCRSRFGPLTDWMAFMDPDEYFVPMGKYTNWKEVLVPIYKENSLKVLKFRSTRARPRISLMEAYNSSKDCQSANSCFAHNSNQTFLKTYNCEYIKSPKPSRFDRAMKQIYRPDYVLSHFVHYSTVTTDLANGETTRGVRTKSTRERFVDEINEGVLVHAKTTPPDETIGYSKACRYKSDNVCLLGFPCPDNLPFSDKTHKDGFQDTTGNYCNCWVNRRIEEVWVPKLEDALHRLRNL